MDISAKELRRQIASFTAKSDQIAAFFRDHEERAFVLARFGKKLRQLDSLDYLLSVSGCIYLLAQMHIGDLEDLLALKEFENEGRC